MLSGYFASQKKEPPKNPVQEQVRAVLVSPVAYSDITTRVEASGRLGSQNYVDVIAEVQGEIMKGNVALKKGQGFRKGDLLFRIFDEEMRYSLQASKSRFLNLIANALPDFKIDFPEAYNGWNDFFRNIDITKPLPEMPGAKSDKEKTFLASRNILTEYYTIKSAEVRLKKYSVYAPFAGAFTEVYLEVGSIANPGSRVARIIHTDKLELEVPVEVEDAKWVVTGSSVEVFSEDRSLKWDGTITRKSAFVDPSTQSVSVFIQIQSTPKQPLYEGQYLRALFSGRNVDNAMEIPRNAVFNNNEVFVVRNGELVKEIVDIKKVNDETLIFSGLEEGIDIVVEPLVNIPERSKVDVIRNK